MQSRLSTKRHVKLITLAVLIALAMGFYLLGNAEEMKTTIPMDVKVENRGAFNLDPDALHFGAAPPGSGSERFVEIKNMRPYAVKVEIYANGEMAGWLKTFDNFFRLEAGESRNVTLELAIPGSTPLGRYNGTLLIIVRKLLF